MNREDFSLYLGSKGLLPELHQEPFWTASETVLPFVHVTTAYCAVIWDELHGVLEENGVNDVVQQASLCQYY